MPVTIESLGLEKYLEYTKGDHNGLNYDDLLGMIQIKTPKVEIAKSFNISRQTLHIWLKEVTL